MQHRCSAGAVVLSSRTARFQALQCLTVRLAAVSIVVLAKKKFNRRESAANRRRLRNRYQPPAPSDPSSRGPLSATSCAHVFFARTEHLPTVHREIVPSFFSRSSGGPCRHVHESHLGSVPSCPVGLPRKLQTFSWGQRPFRPRSHVHPLRSAKRCGSSRAGRASVATARDNKNIASRGLAFPAGSGGFSRV